MRPRICDGSPPVTRLSTLDCAEGCWNVTLASLPTLKLRQSMTARLLSWRTCTLCGVGLEMLAWPATTRPPTGNGSARAGRLARQPKAASSALDNAVGRVGRDRRCERVRDAAMT